MAWIDTPEGGTRMEDDWFAQNAPPPLNQNPYFDPGTNIVPGQDIPLKGYTAPTATPTSAGAGGRMDEAAIRAKVAQWAAMPGADPSLAGNPDYWVGRIKETGGLGSDNEQYWQNASVGPTAFFNNPNRESGGASASLSQIGDYRPNPSYQPPTAPAYNPVNVGTYTPPAPLAPATPYVLPTAAEAEATPGYQFTRDQGLQGVQRSAIGRGAGIGGGVLKELSQFGSGLADSYYGNRVSQGMAAASMNEGNRQNVYSINANTGLGAFNANTNAALGAGQLNLQGTNQQFQNTYQPSWASYLSDVGQNQFGANFGLNKANFGLNAQNQYWNQGFKENQNAFDQYDRSQSSAFDQWLKLANIGNPGNPYLT